MNEIYFRELLNQLLHELTDLGSPLIPFLQAGVSEEYIKAKTETVQFEIPRALYVFFGWKNGVNLDAGHFLGTLELFTLASPISIQESMEAYTFHALENDYWGKNYFPIFESGLGDYFLLDIDQKSATYGMVMYWSPITPYFQGVISLADSFVILLETVLKLYKDRIYHFEIGTDGKKNLACNRKTEIRVWEDYNVKSQYFKTLESFNH